MVESERLELSKERNQDMLIDTHCHIDQFTSPEEMVRECGKNAIRVIAVTNLPSHFAVAADRLRGNTFVSAALGIHPLFATKGVRELTAFKRMVPHVNFIGEIGLDFTRLGASSKSIQEHVFEEILIAIKDRPRFITLHSRGAEAAALEGLRKHGIKAAVFHWFSGSVNDLNQVFADGHFVSINPAMLSSASGRQVIAHAPPDRILVESDGPFAKFQGKPCDPMNVSVVYEALAGHWSVSIEVVITRVRNNFEKITHAFLPTSSERNRI